MGSNNPGNKGEGNWSLRQWGEFRIWPWLKSAMERETMFICNTLWGNTDMGTQEILTRLQGCRRYRGVVTSKKSVDWHRLSIRFLLTTAEWIYTSEKTVDWLGLSIRLCRQSIWQCKCTFNNFKLERGKEVSLDARGMYTSAFSIH